MPLLETQEKPMKPAEFAEHRILEAILDHAYGPGDALPGERVLAQTLGVTRPTLRETLQRLAKEGWVTIAHGKPTRVNDYLAQGGLGILTTLARYGHHLSHDMILHLLQTRTLILPGVAGLAAASDPAALERYLAAACLPGAKESPAVFARFDWGLQTLMVRLSGNPVLGMIFNDFGPVYQVLGERYFQNPEARQRSLVYYRDLAAALESGPKRVSALVETAMAQARDLWEKMR